MRLNEIMLGMRIRDIINLSNLAGKERRDAQGRLRRRLNQRTCSHAALSLASTTPHNSLHFMTQKWVPSHFSSLFFLQSKVLMNNLVKKLYSHLPGHIRPQDQLPFHFSVPMTL